MDDISKCREFLLAQAKFNFAFYKSVAYDLSTVLRKTQQEIEAVLEKYPYATIESICQNHPEANLPRLWSLQESYRSQLNAYSLKAQEAARIVQSIERKPNLWKKEGF